MTRIKGHACKGITAASSGGVLTLKLCCGRDMPPDIDMTRFWFEDVVGARLKPSMNEWDWKDHSYGWNWTDRLEQIKADVILLPSHVAAEHRNKIARLESNTPDRPLQKTSSQSTRNFLELLPTELLLQIFGHFIPTGRIFHFNPTSFGRRRRRGISVQQICPNVGDDLPIIDISSLALTCKRLRDVAYTLFYGENCFVLELATFGLVSRVDLSACADSLPAAIYPLKKPPSFRSWNRVHVPLVSGVAATCSPLTTDTMRYVTNMTICITLSSKNRYRSEELKLMEYLSSVAACFSDARSHSLKRFAVAVTISEGQKTFPYSRQLSVRPGSPLKMEIDWKPRQVRTTGKKRKTTAPIDDLAGPLLRMKGGMEIEAGGLLSPEFVAKLKASVATNSDMDSEPPRKRARTLSDHKSARPFQP